jgi:hypothetical protein
VNWSRLRGWRIFGRGVQPTEVANQPGRRFDGVVFVAPKYDRHTSVTSGWLIDLHRSDSSRTLLLGINVTREKLIESILQFRDGRVLVIFCGHGAKESLLTDPEIGTEEFVDFQGTRHGRLVWAADLLGPQSIGLVAYCCSCGVTFGPEMFAKNSLNQFLGFTAEMPFMFGNENRERSFQAPLKACINVCLANGEIDVRARQALKEALQNEIDQWQSGQYGGEDTVIMAMYLNHHRREIKLIPEEAVDAVHASKNLEN